MEIKCKAFFAPIPAINPQVFLWLFYAYFYLYVMFLYQIKFLSVFNIVTFLLLVKYTYLYVSGVKAFPTDQMHLASTGQMNT